jgi:hypothetical protein
MPRSFLASADPGIPGFSCSLVTTVTYFGRIGHLERPLSGALALLQGPAAGLRAVGGRRVL